jgi:YesN/AraC family two-component response regulator
MARILLIDDNYMLREALTRVLAEAGYEVNTAANGRLALQLFQSLVFDLVITDIVMPEMDGLEFIQEMKQYYPQVKIIAISGGGRCSPQDYLEIAGALGVSATIAKPFANREFLAMVEGVLSS